ncbi:MAG: aryl-sulfate sulfotransferase, partial [Cyclobacteriaceae bacterium]|nr:aryl-sulfate sulfotransferase [Cyclobacteriaceae bacterium]
MKHDKYLIFIFFFSFIFTKCVSDQNTVGVLLNKKGAHNGYTLFTVHQETYLINNKGEVVHQWTSKYSAGKSAYLLGNGNLLRAAQIPSKGKFIMPSAGGRVELFDWDGNLIWEYNYSTPTSTQHHDIYPMPNGNVLILAITIMDKAEATQMGRKLITPPFMQLYNEQIVELKPKNKNEADIVWEWNIKDHIIQDFDNMKDNFGVISENPQLLDINYLGISNGEANWLHVNSIQYNAQLDQIILSTRHLSEIYIIDHSTTTVESASNTGGIYGKGGDLLYR